MTTRFALVTAARASAASLIRSGTKRLLVQHGVEGRLEPALEVIGQSGDREENAVDDLRRERAQVFGRLDVTRTRFELEPGRQCARNGCIDGLAHHLRLAAVNAHGLRRAYTFEVTIEQQ